LEEQKQNRSQVQTDALGWKPK